MGVGVVGAFQKGKKKRNFPLARNSYLLNVVKQGQTVKQADAFGVSEAATAGSGETQPHKPLVMSRRGNLTRKPIGSKDSPASLSKLENRLIDLMAYGIERPLPHWPDIPAGVPLTAQQAGDMLRLRRSRVRQLQKEPGFQKAMAQVVNDIRSGAKARAMNRIVSLIDDAGDGKAADRKVMLEASRDILGIKEAGFSVNVNVNQAVAISPGLVIRDPREQTSQTTIEHDE